MAGRIATLVALTLAACSSTPPARPPAPFTFSGEPQEAPVGGRMVDDRSTTVRVEPLTGRTRVDGVRVEFVYLGFAGTDPAGRTTIRVRYEEYGIADGVESPRPDLRAEIRLDLALGKVLQMKGWRIGVVEATDALIRFVAVSGPP